MHLFEGEEVYGFGEDRFNFSIQNNKGDSTVHCVGKDRIVPAVDQEMKLTKLYGLIRKEIVPTCNMDQGCTIESGDAMDRLITSAQPLAGMQNKNGDTPMHHVARQGFLNIVESLIETDGGADVRIQNRDGDTSLHVASRNAERGVSDGGTAR